MFQWDAIHSGQPTRIHTWTSLESTFSSISWNGRNLQHRIHSVDREFTSSVNVLICVLAVSLAHTLPCFSLFDLFDSLELSNSLYWERSARAQVAAAFLNGSTTLATRLTVPTIRAHMHEHVVYRRKRAPYARSFFPIFLLLFATWLLQRSGIYRHKK